VGEYIIPPVIAALKQKEAQYDLFLDIGNTAAIINQLAKGVFDCAVVEGLFDKTAFNFSRTKWCLFLPPWKICPRNRQGGSEEDDSAGRRVGNI